ncbi:hypothetical protein [Micromonospora sp. NPDC048839]|uniref:hypothetical protein n=1 Tax=Micromonospora sp. NPDC048839 TaxID=3155641 RepID=UPI003408BBC0
MIRTRLSVAAVALAVALTGCGGNSDPEPAAAAVTSAPPSPTAASPSASPSVSPSPTVDPNAPLTLGKSRESPDGAVVSTVYAYKQPVAKTAPRPDEQKGFEWGAVDVKVCVKKDYTANKIAVSHSPWVLVYADDTQIEPSNTGYGQFPQPEYPWGEKVLAPGRCVRGWITYPVPAKSRPVAVEYAAESEPVPPRWVVK